MLVWMDLEMSKKQAERIEALEKEVADLRSTVYQMLLTYPHIGYPISSQTITCSATTMVQAMQNRQESLWRD